MSFYVIKLFYHGNYCGVAVNDHGQKVLQHWPMVANLNTAVIYCRILTLSILDTSVNYCGIL
jgi:hypothetical protein